MITDPTLSVDPHDADDRLVGADRVIAVLTNLAEHPTGITLDELARVLNTKKPTVHRALATLRRAGLADLIGRGVYVLGDEYLRLAFRNVEGRPDNVRIQPLLDDLAGRYGETAHFAVLSGTEVIYRAKTDPPRGAVRLTSVVGGRNPAYRTAVGKALYSADIRSLTALQERLGSGPFERTTANTLTTPEELFKDFESTRQRGFAIDDQENEVGINCVAFPVYLDGSLAPAGAISVSAVTFRCPLDRLTDAVPEMRETIERYLGPHSLG
jgi:IclR family acetate operon transcriptional repressor